MRKSDLFHSVIRYFQREMPVAESELHYENPFQLLIAVILSAQCTDKRVNIVTPALFRRFPDPESLSNASFEDVFELIKSISFPNNKAKYLIDMAGKLVRDFNSEVPSSVGELMTLPGTGRKTANVIASIIYDKPVIAVDTHVFRVSHRIGLSKGKTPEAVEKDLEKYIPEELRPTSHHWLILHGRYVCTARSPKCADCGLKEYCEYFKINHHDELLGNC